ncbi:MAG: TlpA disulfide reductase family protein [Gemmatimonadota bacterium]
MRLGPAPGIPGLPHLAPGHGGLRRRDRGSAAPAFELRALDGGPVSLEQLRGRVVLVNFWATWCPPCRIEMPGFQRVYEERRDEGFVVVGVSTDQAGEGVVRSFLRERGITFPVAMATGTVVRDFAGSPRSPPRS